MKLFSLLFSLSFILSAVAVPAAAAVTDEKTLENFAFWFEKKAEKEALNINENSLPHAETPVSLVYDNESYRHITMIDLLKQSGKSLGIYQSYDTDAKIIFILGKDSQDQDCLVSSIRGQYRSLNIYSLFRIEEKYYSNGLKERVLNKILSPDTESLEPSNIRELGKLDSIQLSYNKTDDILTYTAFVSKAIYKNKPTPVGVQKSTGSCSVHVGLK